MMKSYHTQQGSVNPFFHRRRAPSPFLPSADGRPSAVPAAVPPQAMSALSALPSADAKSSADTAARRWRRDLRPPGTGDVRHDMAWRVPPPGGGGTPCPRRGEPVFTGGNKKGQGHRMVPLPPLDSPKPSFALRLPSVARRNGGYGGSVPCVGSLLGRCKTLNLLCVNRRASQCAARRCRATAFCCEKLRFDQGCNLGAPNVPVGPSLLDARPKGVASKGR